MTSSFVVLSGPSGTGKTGSDIRFIRDGFSLTGFLFPWLWLLAHRLWLPALGAFVMQMLGQQCLNTTRLWPLGAALLLATMLLVGLEGQHLRIRHLLASGWRHSGLTRAGSQKMAEEMYFAGMRSDQTEPAVPVMDTASGTKSGGRIQSSLGLLGFDGGR